MKMIFQKLAPALRSKGHRNKRTNNFGWFLLNHRQLTARDCKTCQMSEQFIKSNTVVSNAHLTPELSLHLITPECKLWFTKSSESVFKSDPFWAIYWPGGQALSRFMLDNRKLFSGKNVLDIGSGSGACAIAAAICGADIVLANDIDELSLEVIKLNAKLNGVEVFVEGNNIIGLDVDSLVIEENTVRKPKWDVILVGDMFYSDEFSKKLYLWLCELASSGKQVFIGDPGRFIVAELVKDRKLRMVAEYPIQECEHFGFSTSSVWQIVH